MYKKENHHLAYLLGQNSRFYYSNLRNSYRGATVKFEDLRVGDLFIGHQGRQNLFGLLEVVEIGDFPADPAYMAAFHLSAAEPLQSPCITLKMRCIKYFTEAEKAMLKRDLDRGVPYVTRKGEHCILNPLSPTKTDWQRAGVRFPLPPAFQRTHNLIRAW